MRKTIHSTICHVALFTIISAENLVAPPPPLAAGALFKDFTFKKTKNLGYSEKIVFFRILMKSYDIFQPSLFHWQNIYVWASKTYKRLILRCPVGFRNKTQNWPFWAWYFWIVSNSIWWNPYETSEPRIIHLQGPYFFIHLFNFWARD